MIEQQTPPVATSPARTAEQHADDYCELHHILQEMWRLAPSKLYPLLQVARSMLDSKHEA